MFPESSDKMELNVKNWPDEGTFLLPRTNLSNEAFFSFA